MEKVKSGVAGNADLESVKAYIDAKLAERTHLIESRFNDGRTLDPSDVLPMLGSLALGPNMYLRPGVADAHLLEDMLSSSIDTEPTVSYDSTSNTVRYVLRPKT